MDNKSKITEIIRVKRGGKGSPYTGLVVRESALTIYLNEHKLVTLTCLHDKLTELGLGYLFSEKIVDKFDKIFDFYLRYSPLRLFLELELSGDRAKVVQQQSTDLSGSGGDFSQSNTSGDDHDIVSDRKETEHPPFPFPSQYIPEIMKEFTAASSLSVETGGVHSAALVRNDKPQILTSADDIGRHNAIDKVIGYSVLNHINLTGCSLLTTGRVSSETINKAVNTSIPVVISSLAPTSKGVSMAYRHNIYLIGLAGDNQYNVYSGIKGW